MIAILTAAIVSISFFDLAGRSYTLERGEEIYIEHNKLVAEFSSAAPSDIQVIDSLGRNVAVSVEAFGPIATIRMKAIEKMGYSCGTMTVVAGQDVFNFLVRPHPGARCVHPRN